MEFNGFFNKLCSFLDHLVSEGFGRSEHRQMLLSSQSGEIVLESLRSWQPAVAAQWAGQRQP